MPNSRWSIICLAAARYRAARPHKCAEPISSSPQACRTSQLVKKTMSYDMISMVDLADSHKRTKRLDTFTAPSGSARSHSQAYRTAWHRIGAEWLGTQPQPIFLVFFDFVFVKVMQNHYLHISKRKIVAGSQFMQITTLCKHDYVF